MNNIGNDSDLKKKKMKTIGFPPPRVLLLSNTLYLSKKKKTKNYFVFNYFPHLSI